VLPVRVPAPSTASSFGISRYPRTRRMRTSASGKPAAFQAKVKLPSGTTDASAGILVGFDGGTDAGYAVVINPNNGGQIRICPVTGGDSIGGSVAATNCTIQANTQYTITVVKKQAYIQAWVDQVASSRVAYSSSNIAPFGSFGLISEAANTTFDDFRTWSGFPREHAGRRWRSSAKTSLNTGSGELTVEAKDHGGEAVFTGHRDDYYFAEVEMNLNGGADAALYVLYLDPDNWYRIRLDGTYARPERMRHGVLSALGGNTTYNVSNWRKVEVSLTQTYGLRYKVEGQAQWTTVPLLSGLSIHCGGVALSGWQAKFRNLKVGYDMGQTSDLVIDENFSSTSVSPTYDDNGNLTKDADHAYVYDAWDNLVRVRAQNDADITFAQYAYYGNDQRAKKAVTKRGSLDGTTYFFYDGAEVIEEEDGSQALQQQYVWGPNHTCA